MRPERHRGGAESAKSKSNIWQAMQELQSISANFPRKWENDAAHAQ